MISGTEPAAGPFLFARNQPDRWHTLEHNGTENLVTLSSRQLAALPHIAASPTVAEAARSSGIGRTTLYRWLRDEEFRRSVDTLRSEAGDIAKAALQALMLRGIVVLSDAMDDPDAGIRLRAASTTLYNGLKANDLKDIQRRLEALDDALALRTARAPQG